MYSDLILYNALKNKIAFCRVLYNEGFSMGIICDKRGNILLQMTGQSLDVFCTYQTIDGWEVVGEL